MEKIPLFNLKRQYTSLIPQILEVWKQTLETTQFTSGTETHIFEKNFAQWCDSTFGLGVRSGTASLIAALKAAGIGPGDEVITTCLSFSATADAIILAGGKPIFVDVLAKDGNIDPNLIEKAITVKTKAVLIVHLYGIPCAMKEIVAITKRNHLLLIEDASHAHGSTYNGKKVGSFGLAGCFSLYPSKTLGCTGNGGMITSNNKQFIEKAYMYAHHGLKRNGKKYNHFVVGQNELMDNLQAAVLNIKLASIDQVIARKRKITSQYNDAFTESGQIGMEWEESVKPSLYIYSVQIEQRTHFQNWMEERGIETGIYYPTPLHLQKSLQYLGYQKGDFPVGEKFFRQTISLPLYPELKEEEVQRIQEAITSFFH